MEKPHHSKPAYPGRRQACLSAIRTSRWKWLLIPFTLLLISFVDSPAVRSYQGLGGTTSSTTDTPYTFLSSSSFSSSSSSSSSSSFSSSSPFTLSSLRGFWSRVTGENDAAALTRAIYGIHGGRGGGGEEEDGILPPCSHLHRIVILKERPLPFQEVHGFLLDGFRNLGFEVEYMERDVCFGTVNNLFKAPSPSPQPSNPAGLLANTEDPRGSDIISSIGDESRLTGGGLGVSMYPKKTDAALTTAAGGVGEEGEQGEGAGAEEDDEVGAGLENRQARHSATTTMETSSGTSEFSSATPSLLPAFSAPASSFFVRGSSRGGIHEKKGPRTEDDVTIGIGSAAAAAAAAGILAPCYRDDVIVVTTSFCLTEPNKPYPVNMLIVNLEVLDPDIRVWQLQCLHPKFAEKLWQRGPAWDYNYANIDFLQENNLASSLYMPLRYYPGIVQTYPETKYSDRYRVDSSSDVLDSKRNNNVEGALVPSSSALPPPFKSKKQKRKQQQQQQQQLELELELQRKNQQKEPFFDVLFLGSLAHSKRRNLVLTQFLEAGLKVDILTDLFNVTREERVKNAKIVVNIHFYTKNFETPRLFWLLSVGAFIITEADPAVTPQSISEYSGTMVFAPYAELFQTVMTYLGEDKKEERKQIADRGYAFIRSSTPASILRPLVEQSLFPGGRSKSTGIKCRLQKDGGDGEGE